MYKKRDYPTLQNDPNISNNRSVDSSSGRCSKRIVSLEHNGGTPDYILEKYSGEWFMKWRCSRQRYALGPISTVDAKHFAYDHADSILNSPPLRC
jgi:hypothetical protein